MVEIKNLIICNPYEPPKKHWKYERSRREFELTSGRRPAGFLSATPDSKSYDDPGVFHEIQLVNQIRKRVDAWRQDGYAGVTGITRKLLESWHNDRQREKQFFFCQLEAIETLIWLVEAPHTEKQGITIPSDGGDFARWCCKMATGTGKTIVMAMVISWHVINKATYPHDTRFSKNILVMAPGLTVKSRLKVLNPSSKDNIYDEFEIVPESLRQKIFQSNITIHNWHTLMPEEDPPKSVVKRGKESNSAFSKRILGHNFDNIVVINDEAHHAYRAEDTKSTKSAPEMERDKRWIEGLDMIHSARKIIHCFDFSATPFIPSGKNVTEDMLFDWIVSDFSLNDAIESGLTKTPKIAIRDDANKFSKDYRSRFYHIYNNDEVHPDLNRSARPHEKLPDLVTNAYMLLGSDYIETKKAWGKKRHPVPPVMITICNNTHTAARVMHAFENNRFELDELSAPKHILHIDSTTIKKAEEQETARDGKEEDLRKIVDTVGKRGKPGEQIRNIIAVQMLSEGWDARNVTHIMGLRAFSSQLLCEQVIGRGLRRVSYEINKKTGLYNPEYVNVFGVPFTFLPHEGKGCIKPPPPTTIIEPDSSKIMHEIAWPNIDRIDMDYFTRLEVDWSEIEPIRIQSSEIGTKVDMAQIVAGKPHEDKVSDIDLRGADKEFRLQRVVFLASKNTYHEIAPDWRGTKESLVSQIILLVDEFIRKGKIYVTDSGGDVLRTRIAMIFNMQKIAKHVCQHIRDKSIENKSIHINQTKSVKSTSDMRMWHTKKPAEHNKKSHINLAPYDSKWELAAIHELEQNKNSISWVKNDHLGFVIKYLYNGVTHDYWPDFLIKLKNNLTLVLEIKGIDSEQDQKKRDSLEEWTQAVNENGNYGAWASDVAYSPESVRGIINKHAKSKTAPLEYAKCPKCFRIAQTRKGIEDVFGFRNVNGITRPQSWCKICRTKNEPN